ncbi:MAG: transglutaminase-like domain-containing protein, partial [Bacteroidia bacterium]
MRLTKAKWLQVAILLQSINLGMNTIFNKKKFCLVICFLFSSLHISWAQKNINEYYSIDKKALSMPDSCSKTSQGIANYISANFTTDKDKIRAAFVWIGNNIQYDVDYMFALNFYEKKEDKIAKPLKTRKGICENYAELFNDICNKSNIKSIVISGYTKQNGFVDYLPHAWCAVFVGNKWVI